MERSFRGNRQCFIKIKNPHVVYVFDASPPNHDSGPCLPQDPSATIIKTFAYTPASRDGLASIDDTIAYTITASNDGNVDLSQVTMTDERFLNSQGESS